jgi:hypothetical protein
MISSPIRFKISCRSWSVVRDQDGNTCLAAATARSASAREARGKWPTTSPVFDGLRSGAALPASTHSPAMKFLA